MYIRIGISIYYIYIFVHMYIFYGTLVGNEFQPNVIINNFLFREKFAEEELLFYYFSIVSFNFLFSNNLGYYCVAYTRRRSE